jgi:hypothetical protein
VVVVPRWTSSRVQGPVSLLPCRVYSPVRASGNGCPLAMFVTRYRLVETPFLLPRGGRFVFPALKITGVCATYGDHFFTIVDGSDPTVRPIVVGLRGVCTPFGVEFLTWTT